MSHSHLNWFSCHESSACRDTSQWSYSWGDYVALSYTWGDPTDTRNIILNGHQTAIGANLESALRVLRDKQPIKLGYQMWVDALCINQRDIVERGQEVKRMRKIYRQARNVVIWLGNEGDESDKAMGLIRILSNACETGEDRALGTALRKQPDLLGRGCWRALSKLLDRPYWDRLWVLQEIALGVGRTSILCGQKAVTWRELYNASFSFGTHNVDVMFSLIDQERRDAGLPAAGLKRNKLTHLDTEQLVQAGRAKGQFMCMLDLGRKSLAMDPKDKVYGLLGMLEASLSDHIVPDYNATVSQVFTDFAKAFIVANNSLELLEQCTWSTKGMPSWVPDWTDTDHFRLYSGRSTYHATKSASAVFYFENNDQSLSCQGARMDSIDGLGERYFQDFESHRCKDVVLQPKGRKNVYGSEEALKEALWNTLVGSRDAKGRKAPTDYQCLLDCSPMEDLGSSTSNSRGRTAFNRLITQSADLQIAGKRLGSYFPPASSPDAEVLRDPLERVFRFVRTRRLMVTLNGSIGLVPNDAQQGDVVCLLLGCNVPIVLRAVEQNRYKVVGSCYIHGVMEGEAMEWLKGGQNHVEEIHLC